MITQLLTDPLNDLKTDTTTVAGLAFLAFLVIYFFVVMKPAIDSKRRINRQVQRQVERDKATEIYQKQKIKKQMGNSIKLADVNRIYNQQQQSKLQWQRQRKNNGY